MRIESLDTALLDIREHAKFLFEVRREIGNRVSASGKVQVAIDEYLKLSARLVVRCTGCDDGPDPELRRLNEEQFEASKELWKKVNEKRQDRSPQLRTAAEELSKVLDKYGVPEKNIYGRNAGGIGRLADELNGKWNDETHTLGVGGLVGSIYEREKVIERKVAWCRGERLIKNISCMLGGLDDLDIALNNVLILVKQEVNNMDFSSVWSKRKICGLCEKYAKRLLYRLTDGDGRRRCG